MSLCSLDDNQEEELLAVKLEHLHSFKHNIPCRGCLGVAAVETLVGVDAASNKPCGFGQREIVNFSR